MFSSVDPGEGSVLSWGNGPFWISVRKAGPASGGPKGDGGVKMKKYGQESVLSSGAWQPRPGSDSSLQWLKASQKEATPWGTQVCLLLRKGTVTGDFQRQLWTWGRR